MVGATGCDFAIALRSPGWDVGTLLEQGKRVKKETMVSLHSIHQALVPLALTVALSFTSPVTAGGVDEEHLKHCGVDLLTASGSVPRSLSWLVERSSLLDAHHGGLQAPHAATEVWSVPECKQEARGLAAKMGLPDTAVLPLGWKTPYGITIAVGDAAKATVLQAIAACAAPEKLSALLRQGVDPGVTRPSSRQPFGRGQRRST